MGTAYCLETAEKRRPDYGDVPIARAKRGELQGLGRQRAAPDNIAPGKQIDTEDIYKVFPDGSHYKGQWRDNSKSTKAHGHGTYTSKRSKYVGEWQNDLKHGQAVEEWDNASTYTGTYSHGQKHGEGRFEWPEGPIYNGDFRNNNVEGEGTFTWRDGRHYKGQWFDNRMHGEGRYEWPDGRSYNGQYADDLKEGKGTFFWPDGRRFAGQWKDGKQHGDGVFCTAHGDQRAGAWREGVRLSGPLAPRIDGREFAGQQHGVSNQRAGVRGGELLASRISSDQLLRVGLLVWSTASEESSPLIDGRPGRYQTAGVGKCAEYAFGEVPTSRTGAGERNLRSREITGICATSASLPRELS